MKEFLIGSPDILGLAYWIEIVTKEPNCTYYFGPFLSQKGANAAQYGYIEDLSNESAQGIDVTIKRCKPNQLTIFDELGEMSSVLSNS